MRPDPVKVVAINKMPAPTSVPEVRRFLGMCNYLSRFIPKLSQVSEETECEETDYHSMRCQYEGSWCHPIARGTPYHVSFQVTHQSRKKTTWHWNLSALQLFLHARSFTIISMGSIRSWRQTTKPLEVIAKKSILAAPRRLQRMLLQLQQYDLEITYRPGKQQWIADILSRLPVESPIRDKFGRQEIFHTNHGELESQEFSTVDETDYVRVKDERIEEVRQAAQEDVEQELLRKVIVDGWPPSIRDTPVGVRCYWNFRDTLTVSDGVIYKGDQIVVLWYLHAANTYWITGNHGMNRKTRMTNRTRGTH